ncbi:phage holin family protein [Lysobacter korlensis]|uniref:Phage holin family protein n=1 Tax=Lysobacter korlensis TaxID=553636 RepID=A0ABV6RI60_9GAMM
MHATGEPGESTPGARGRAPGLLESLRELRDAGRSGAASARDASKALRTLVSADVALARSAIGRAVAFIAIAIVFGGSAWLLLMTALIVALVRHLDWPWSVALLSTATLSLAVTAYAAWRTLYYFEHTRLRATRRQLARLGFGELADYMPDPGSPESTRAASDRLAENPPAKDERGIDLTPP